MKNQGKFIGSRGTSSNPLSQVPANRPAPIGAPISTADVYRWTGNFVAVAIAIVAVALAALAANYASKINADSTPLIGRESQKNQVLSVLYPRPKTIFAYF